mmetsp:Transcript_10480/g.18931  ORF Transcript_10480/g.18931 Transcript_10480/m.18931 type:complete len:361 (+) Transcript_10480:106-1188(+)
MPAAGKKASKVQVPECRYGAACMRPDCVFRHPPKTKDPAAKLEKSDKVCFSFVAGQCAFGRQCRDKHPDEASCRTIRERYAKIDCQWGKGCKTEGCLYRHPTDEPIGPPMPPPQRKPQPAVFAEGPKIPLQTTSTTKAAVVATQAAVTSSPAQAVGVAPVEPSKARWHAPIPNESIRPDLQVQECSAPPLPRLNQWIDDEDGQQVWGPPLVTTPDSVLQPSHFGASGCTSPADDVLVWRATANHGRAPVERPPGPPPQRRDPPGPPPQRRDPCAGSFADFPPNVAAALEDAAAAAEQQNQRKQHQQQQQEDAEERARQEQLAATLRCMGFDEEPSLQAAHRAGGNLNRAVESLLGDSAGM